ncbi:MAG: DUF1508 domain-containing protein [Flavobacterium sp.]|nr:DUF1508 domain-containing protein [Flavobacterium sp.]
MGAFVISKRFDDYYKFIFTSRKGKAIFASFRYELKFECEEGIEYFKNAIDSVVFEKVKSAAGKYYFKIILEETHFATSRKYNTELLLDKGINEIRNYAFKAEILDFTLNEVVFPE